MPGAGRQTKAGAAHAAPFSSGVAAQGIGFEGFLRVGENADGRLEVFSRGSDEALWHRWQLTPGGSWSGWASLGGFVCSIGPPASVALDAGGRLEVFSGTSEQTGINHNRQLTPGGAWSGWELFEGVDINDPTVARNADGRLEVFAYGPGNPVVHKWQLTPSGAWSGWSTL